MTETILKELIRQAMHQADREINFVWQGGEPMLQGLNFFRKAVDLQQKYDRGQIVGNGLQTNGLLIDDPWTQFLRSYQWLVGLSLDGPRHVHDHYDANRWNPPDCAIDAGASVRIAGGWPNNDARYVTGVPETFNRMTPAVTGGERTC